MRLLSRVETVCFFLVNGVLVISAGSSCFSCLSAYGLRLRLLGPATGRSSILGMIFYRFARALLG